MRTLFEQNGGTYRLANGYRVPNLTLPDNESEYTLGIWGRRRLNYLKQHRRVLYVNLLTSGKLAEHLREIDETAFSLRELLIKQMKKAQGVNEQMKAKDSMLWVGKVNNICSCADEIIREELIYS